MDLSTNYLGMKLRTPLVPSASPLSEEIDNIKRMEDAGASAIVMYSLFEEQITHETYELYHHLTKGTESFAESLTYFPEPDDFVLRAEEYVEHVRKTKAAVDIPIIASLNAHSEGGWSEYAKHIQDAGADALELNIYYIPTDMNLAGEDVDKKYVDILKSVKSAVNIPLAVKLSPFFSNFANIAKRLDAAGADALVLFNRFYQPDIELETLEVVPRVLLSTPMALRLPMRWIAILYGKIKADLAATSGVHKPPDVLKMLMAGANVTMLCSVLLKHGIDQIRVIEQGMKQWMEEYEYESVRQMQGSMSQQNCPHPSAFERAQYMRALHSYDTTKII
ncbi:dihydroorotate dehydrogenase-like protein [candidate division KSB1 bacterium]|nr:dihydroorotate dehydrogenase-like protein [candidate division KSB1 bacterium]NIR70595.1 dihydroorotate dehydrogenase-like protein [candidate division KSB1 bacterium]NIS24540.1 dihydroorotate dehydrogenase-like protein [candidate division KSB1 bacterium]NIT71458.1 dihydroorotate dehydrogenase-like protein [candidate division KSB1 bacterium]NIU25149.1 dihydroorotate dehydrogenase-like protein [candidate division KSB1 bacterium]